MKKIEYCIVGGGYAGIFIAHQLMMRGASFLLFDEGKSSASKISAGVVNPVVLKKFTPFWKASEQILALSNTMEEMSKYLGENFFVQVPIHRIFHDEQEEKLWHKKRQNTDLECFLEDGKVFLPYVENNYGCGRVLNGGYVQVERFFQKYYEYLEQNDLWKKQKFEYEKFDIHQRKYGEYTFENIVFCEGASVKCNPFFGNLPIVPNKGHQLSVCFQDTFKLDAVVKKKHFLIPIAGQKYYYGGTYDRQDMSEAISPNAVAELCEGLELITKLPYSIEEQNKAFRPTVFDRKPIMGRHIDIPHLYVFNGLGARGLLNGAYFSPILVDFIERKVTLPEEVSLERFL